jgi:purine-binding chemotaxis protein CheW
MSSQSLTVASSARDALTPYAETQHEFVTMRLDGQMFGVSVMAVQDVLRNLTVSPIPLAPRVVSGALNIRGRIVTAINMRARLTMPAFETPEKTMYVVVEYQNELYALLVDAVGDVLTLPMQQFEKTPANLDQSWRSLSAGVFKLSGELLVILDVANIIDGINA